MDLKFNIGDKVKVKADGEVGEVLRFQVSNNGIMYTITSKEVDLKEKRVIEGVKHCMEDELEEVEEEEDE